MKCNLCYQTITNNICPLKNTSDPKCCLWNKPFHHHIVPPETTATFSGNRVFNINDDEKHAIDQDIIYKEHKPKKTSLWNKFICQFSKLFDSNKN